MAYESYAGADFGVIPDPNDPDAIVQQYEIGMAAFELEARSKDHHQGRLDGLQDYTSVRFAKIVEQFPELFEHKDSSER